MLKEFLLNSIGFIRKNEGKIWLEIEEKFEKGLLRLDDFSHVIVLWWIEGRDNKEDRAMLQVYPKVDGTRENVPLVGVFACRSPGRPNPIGLTISKIISRKDNRLYIDRTDAFDNTPILDLKPYIPKSECILSAKVPDFMSSLQKPRE
ncbi:MAG TPA: tRNA (N6-threonylcarbamoyladenosine(37)-N6)-methyltransferase TrmO [candidate division Zixibacteria bacterium]|nr:tRNA (N6-threonylcarbamoyladenosine(37)-N6)-methyltransferase TrmO [candidate division Zixibacteria bacterium]